MLQLPVPTSWARIQDTVTTRSAVVGTIALVVAMMGLVALVAMFSGDIPERAAGIVTTVLGSMATVLAGLLLFLRLDTVNSKVDDAAEKAAVAAEKAAVVERKVDRVHDDVLNGPMRENVKRAISEDRHAQRNRDTVLINKDQLEELRRRAGEKEPPV